MLSLNDERWKEFEGGYRIPFDPRPFLFAIEAGKGNKAAWHELWEGLHHQGDVGLASYASAPHIARIYRERATSAWDTYAIVATIELARSSEKNPELPDWLKDDYFQAIRSLAEQGATRVLREKDADVVRAMLSVIAIAAGARVHARFFLWYSGEELLHIESRAAERE